MTLLEKIKKEYVKQKYGFDYSHPFYEEKDLDEIAKRYAKAVLERAADSASIKVHDGHFKKDSLSKHVQVGANNFTIDKQSILNTKID